MENFPKIIIGIANRIKLIYHIRKNNNKYSENKDIKLKMIYQNKKKKEEGNVGRMRWIPDRRNLEKDRRRSFA